MAPRGRGRVTRSSTRASNSVSLTHESLPLPESGLSSPLHPSGQYIYLAHERKPTDAECRAAYRTGIEALSDASHALLQSLVPVRSWKRLWDPNSSHLPRHGHAASSSDGVEWRTARLAYPCSCNLPIWRHAYAPPFPPPTASALPRLRQQPKSDQMVHFGDDVPEWVNFGLEGDLDPAIDDLAEFEHEWPTATPWRRDKGKGRAQPPNSPPFVAQRLVQPQAFDCFLPESSLFSSTDFRPSTRLPPTVQHQQPSRRASPPLRSRPVPHRAPPSSALSSPTADESPLPEDYVLDARMRRAWWRDNMAHGCGAFWDTITRPVYPAPSIRSKHRVRRDDAYRVPRNLARLNHPLHPDVYHYCKHAGTRVYWLIPIHGPVIVPGLEDPVTNPSARPWASRAEFGTKLSNASPSKPIVVRWVPALLHTFLKELFEPAWRDPARYGALHLAFSGPKPDPYLAPQPPPPLEAHTHTPEGARGRVPVRVEAGDHMRIYCDAAFALSLRTWLHWWETDGRRPFDRARFALVGPRGEVLVVA
ncbi:hypothetical protein CcaverHIS002_0109560 [Cutaneotrichosporon cavernicola]|uniref:Uncharacterized protein n=1 Tax=Cutaneotrichosporon cavernicola TaxID=279322 RepID=A0AA48I6Z4_9TREE|nr:uncharacterized protein CcaverHIS019_0109480 [Cutaneotrichosporon cavernicola]BEI80427.1 hypothetical protein CcaverHIS002_0109560 [Cutaneotrichosporon cavernicola]BEI88230.1 hypothetical protein CcaverHIS019_0109480 [Cutaneotrichosporon cavernicola]BEI96001.1 hypothetical protein CcaverHIS631_0109500 [Cutaneotrichosporon cavernicola]BEJ03775.1 hypothetical protein CcaverHIS641_0109500 [Cutaneotrichosporon cavernicola]